MGTLTEYAIDGIGLVAEVFIETGLWKGNTFDHALQQGFKELHSMDIYLPLVESGRERFGGDPRVHLYHGSSPAVLPQVMRPDLWTTFWLDAHYQGCDTYEIDPEAGQCPLMLELAAIRRVPWLRLPFVLIDDAHLFRRPWDERLSRLFDPSQWPVLGDIEAMLPEYRLVEHEDILYYLPVG
jgi:hypothetical protein